MPDKMGSITGSSLRGGLTTGGEKPGKKITLIFILKRD